MRGDVLDVPSLAISKRSPPCLAPDMMIDSCCFGLGGCIDCCMSRKESSEMVQKNTIYVRHSIEVRMMSCSFNVGRLGSDVKNLHH